MAADGKLLDHVLGMFRQGDVANGFDTLVEGLREIRLGMDAEPWARFVEEVCRGHALLAEVLQDPLTHRAFAKPRGYAGDAVILDYIYAGQNPPAELLDACTPLGRQVYQAINRDPACRGVRERRRIIADAIDDIAASRSRPEVFSVACGHVREAQLSKAVAAGALGRYVALDQDAASLNVVEQELGALGVQTLHARVRELVRGTLDVGRFDLVYSVGLYDYLQDPLARRLTQVLFQMLRPGGRLLVANFIPKVRVIGYLEAYMDWWLLFRTDEEMLDLTRLLPPEEVGSTRLFAEENNNIVFLEVTRAE